MNQLQRYFKFQGEGIRVVIKNNDPWFVARDVTDILRIDRTQSRSLPERLKDVCSIHTPGGKQDMLIIDESGFYRLVLKSRSPHAEEFQTWVTEEVLPTIRKTGTYAIPGAAQEYLTMSEEDRAIAYFEQRKQLKELQPKVEAFDLFLSADNAQSMNVVAKSLGTGRTRLFQLLRDKNILMANNTPKQAYIERGYFRVVEKPITMGDTTINKPQTLVTSKGVDYIGRLVAGVQGGASC